MPRVNSEGGRAWCEDCSWDHGYRDAQYAAVAAARHRSGRCHLPRPRCPDCGFVPQAASYGRADQSLRRHIAARACRPPRGKLCCPDCGWTSVAAEEGWRRSAVARHIARNACRKSRTTVVSVNRMALAFDGAGYRHLTPAQWVAHFDAFPEVYVMLWAQVFKGWGLRQVCPGMMRERAGLKANAAIAPARATG